MVADEFADKPEPPTTDQVERWYKKYGACVKEGDLRTINLLLGGKETATIEDLAKWLDHTVTMTSRR